MRFATPLPLFSLLLLGASAIPAPSPSVNTNSDVVSNVLDPHVVDEGLLDPVPEKPSFDLGLIPALDPHLLVKRQGAPFHAGRTPGPAGGQGTGFGVGGGPGDFDPYPASSDPAGTSSESGDKGDNGAGEADLPGQGQATTTATQTATTERAGETGGTMSGETVIEVATQDINTVSHLIVASASPSSPDSGSNPDYNPTTFGPANPGRVSVYHDPSATATAPSGTGTVTNAAAGFGSGSTSTSTSSAARALGRPAGGGILAGWLGMALGMSMSMVGAAWVL